MFSQIPPIRLSTRPKCAKITLKWAIVITKTNVSMHMAIVNSHLYRQLPVKVTEPDDANHFGRLEFVFMVSDANSRITK